MAATKKHAEVRTTELEFGGVIGTTLMVFTLPLAVYLINLACSQAACSLQLCPVVPGRLSDYFDLRVSLVYLGWVVLQAAIASLPLGREVKGQQLRTGQRLNYRCNALHALLLSVAMFCVLVWLGVPVTYVYHKYLQVITTAVLSAFLLSVGLYVHSFCVAPEQLALGGNSGYIPYDFFMGRELNPRLGPLDLKFLCELRPGLIGWVLLDLVFMTESYRLHGTISPAMVLVVCFHACYVIDALWFEEAVLTTMDIVHDGFGYMLAFGDLVWVPFLYNLQARFLLEHPQHWSPLSLLAILLVHVIGYTIFRASNLQKNNFRTNPKDPSLAHLQTLSTERGTKLIVSGWWGMCRHPNYLGDLIMALSWSLPCGFSHALPYFYPVYFMCLLIHRCLRDDANCRKKYGKDWDKYCKMVPYRIFPYVY